LAALGKTSEAAEHYRRAYELMPDSFGRVESHCFGCERVFDGEQAQSIAEKVFTQLVAERPNKPQVYYLLGYLQTEEEHYNEAWTNFQTAVRLDPDYLNAWAKLQEVSKQIVVSPEDKEDIALNIMRLIRCSVTPQPILGVSAISRASGMPRPWLNNFSPNPLPIFFRLRPAKLPWRKNQTIPVNESGTWRWRR
jgi:tetratricopeptide (TPR) repeat protein